MAKKLTKSKAGSTRSRSSLNQDGSTVVTTALFMANDRKLSAECIARYCGVSARHLRRLIRKHTGRTLRDYIADVAVAQAKLMLRDVKSSVKSVVQLVGYSSRSHFSAVFVERTGMTPAQFARKVAKAKSCGRGLDREGSCAD